jgi:hypothetical protein
MHTLKNVGILGLTFVLSILLYYPFYSLYPFLFTSARVGGLFMVWEEIAMITFGAILAYIFFLPLLFTAVGGLKKYRWIGILLIPAAAFEVYFDWSHIYFPIIVGLVGWGVGWGVAKFIASRKPQVI